jgi:S-adenosylmethionine:tRNA ribosyltransferase-isomerase
MKIEEFDFDLPGGQIAQEPAPRREASRLMLVQRAGDAIGETTFAHLADHLRPGDLLVLNDTRVLPARLRARKPTGGQVEILVLERTLAGGTAVGTAMLSTSKGLHPGTRLSIAAGFAAEILEGPEGGRARLRFEVAEPGGAAEGAAGGAPEPADRLAEAFRAHGVMPLPPYIRRDAADSRDVLDRERYQTVYAAREGAVAAPTAGLHFTPAILDDLPRRGVEVARLTLHVGPGTFQPVRVAAIDEHRVEPERFSLPAETAAAVAACRRRGGRVVAVGTTVTRVLEARAGAEGGVEAGDGWCDLYIRPGHRFRAVDALLTNLHLPRSSLLILVAAFAGRERILAAYREAIRRGFRFYSYGDAMLIA